MSTAPSWLLTFVYKLTGRAPQAGDEDLGRLARGPHRFAGALITCAAGQPQSALPYSEGWYLWRLVWIRIPLPLEVYLYLLVMCLYIFRLHQPDSALTALFTLYTRGTTRGNLRLCYLLICAPSVRRSHGKRPSWPLRVRGAVRIRA